MFVIIFCFPFGCESFAFWFLVWFFFVLVVVAGFFSSFSPRFVFALGGLSCFFLEVVFSVLVR